MGIHSRTVWILGLCPEVKRLSEPTKLEATDKVGEPGDGKPSCTESTEDE